MKLRNWRSYIIFSLRGWLIWLVSMASASLTCAFLRTISTTDVHVPLIFVLAVLVVSLLTEGYFYGILAAVASVFMVNFAFTYPYAKLDFTIYGYPLTFLTMLTVGCAISALMSRVKEQEELRMEARSEKLRANLLRSLSHDLRTPLTSISGALSAVLEEDTLSEDEKRAFLLGAQQDVEWLYRMSENLLTITRITDVEISRLQLSEELLEEILSAAASNFRKHQTDVALHVHVPEEVLFVRVDAMLIEQVLLNLFYNAVQHGKKTTDIWVDVRTREELAEISVTDNGRGIEKDVLDHLFDGSLASAARSADATRGMGIGLTVCGAIIEAHGGTIRAEQAGETQGKPAAGARFIFTLKRA